MLKKIVVCCSLVSTLFLFGCGKSLEKDVVGKWSYDFSLPLDDKDSSGQMTVKCVSDFFANKSINHNCEFTVAGSAKDDGQKFEMAGNFRSTGDWSVADKTVFDKTIDGKVELLKFAVNGEAIDDKEMLEKIQKDMDSPFVKGETSTYVTISNDGKKWVYETEVEKKKVTVTATKQ